MKKTDVLRYYEDDHFDAFWDNQVTDYPLDRFPWYDMILAVVQEVNPKCDDLSELHNFFDRTEIVPLRKKVERYVRTKEFAEKLDEYFDYIIGDQMPEYLIQATPTLNFVLPDQQRQGGLLTFHTGHLTAYNPEINTIWTPVSPAWGSNSMQVCTWEDSKRITKEMVEENLSLSEIQRRCEEVSWPVEIKQGQAWLFGQGYWHGNINNTTGKSRIGLDVRAMPRGYEHGYRKPGSYSRFPGTTLDVPTVDPDRRWIVFNDPAAGDYMGTMPFYIPRQFIELYADKLGIKPVGWHNEYMYTDWNPHLEFFINETEVEGIALLSMHGLSSTINRRMELFEQCVNKDIHVLFCDENFLLDSVGGLDYIKKCLEF
tara:strand:+ start:4120 stop:5232 length:1113 start_codon:yes stop_codon:yes gene_type:complete